MTLPLWRQIQRKNFTRLDALVDFLELTPLERSHLLERPRFPLNIPLRLAQKIAKRTLDDPILLQFIPRLNEAEFSPAFSEDPVRDTVVRLTPHLLHKYHGRALLLTTSACPMHCRYCFRQNFPYENSSDFSVALEALASDPTIHEVILSGGDPLSLSNKALQILLASLGTLPHVRRIRFHTRFPIGIPERLDEDLLALLEAHPQRIFFVLHINHPRELDTEIQAALLKLQKLGIPLLNQSVLLKGVNDDENTLLTLCETLIDNGILPYYLNLLDRVTGSAHFEVSLERGQQLIAYLEEHLSGYGIPKLVRDIPGQSSKTTFSQQFEGQGVLDLVSGCAL